MIANRVIKNSVWIIGGQVFRMLISFVVSILTTRYLGPSDFGLLSYVQSYISFFTAIIGLGLNGVIVYKLVNQDCEGEVLGSAIYLRLWIGIISLISFISFAYYTEPTDDVFINIVFLQSIQLPFLCLDTLQYWFQAHLLSKYTVMAQSISHFFALSFKVYLLIAGKNVEWFAFALSLDIGLLSLLYYIFYRKQNLSGKLFITKEKIKEIAVSCLPFALASITTVIYSQMDKVMIKSILNSDSEVGLYTAALTICTLISFIPNAIIESARPLVMEAKRNDESIYVKRFKQMSASVFWVCLFYSICICIFSKLVIYILYGEDFLSANFCLRIAVWYTTFSFIGSIKSIWLICENKTKYVLVFSIMGVGTNLLLNLILIPQYSINGAAMATFLTEIFVNFVFPFIFESTRKYSILILESIILKDIPVKIMFKKLFNK